MGLKYRRKAMEGSTLIRAAKTGVFFIGLLALLASNTSMLLCRGASTCVESERRALLRFKQELSDTSSLLASWTGVDCCEWSGVICKNLTGNVHELFLGASLNSVDNDNMWPMNLGGKISPSLLDLKHLSHLDLSMNDFGGNRVPSFLGSLSSLTSLNLSNSGFSGEIPYQLGNLTNLVYLDLKGNSLYASNLLWLSQLSSLEYLDLSSANLSEAHDWLEVTNDLSSLLDLRLSNCYVSSNVPTPGRVNFTSLSHLDLSSNGFPLIPTWIFEMRGLDSLDLSKNEITGPIPHGLQNLSSLKSLDLSSLSLSFNMIPSSFYRFSHLEVLRFGNNNLKGPISSDIRNLSSITTLDLSWNELEGKLPSSFGELCNLKQLDLSANLWIQEIGQVLESLSGCASNSLEFLDLNNNEFSGQLTDQIGQFKSLTYLDLHRNPISGSIPMSFAKLGKLREISLSDNKLKQQMSQALESFNGPILDSLESLDLSFSQLFGHLTNQIGQFHKLTSLTLASNSLSGPIPTSLANLSSLRFLDLSDNFLNETLPQALGQLSNLETFYISRNLLSGTVTEVHFANMTSLKHFEAARNPLTLNVSQRWILPFRLSVLNLRSWNLGPQDQFPQWLQSQEYLYYLDMSNTRLSCAIPSWFGGFSAQFVYLNLSQNELFGPFPDMTKPSRLFGFVFDLSFNKFEGSLPIISSSVGILDLSNNRFSGSISSFLCSNSSTEPMSLQILNLWNNQLSGRVPDCWTRWPRLSGINLSRNKFIGTVPASIGTLFYLQSLNLRANGFSGELPLFLQDLSRLFTLELGDNKFRGNIPAWIGKKLSNLRILVLRSNELDGQIPRELCGLSSLQILDIAHNNLSGTIPKCFNNFSAMATRTTPDEYNFDVSIPYGTAVMEQAQLAIKGRMADYDKILRFVKSIDLSGNSLSGSIPAEITNLSSLLSLNLSHNLLTGRIPAKMGDMRALESIDLSANGLSGEIPQTMASLSFLSYLNLSHNNLTGMIPRATQLQSLDASSFGGNHLCGAPLTKKCNDDEAAVSSSEENMGEKDGVEMDGFYVSLALGFVVGLLGLVGSVLLNSSWGVKYFQFLDKLLHKLCVRVYERRR